MVGTAANQPMLQVVVDEQALLRVQLVLAGYLFGDGVDLQVALHHHSAIV